MCVTRACGNGSIAVLPSADSKDGEIPSVNGYHNERDITFLRWFSKCSLLTWRSHLYSKTRLLDLSNTAKLRRSVIGEFT
jgi:hypothetical protein